MVALTDEEEKSHLMVAHRGKHGTMIRRLAKTLGPAGSAIMRASAIPKLNHLLRTHPPNVCGTLAEEFYAGIRSTCAVDR